MMKRLASALSTVILACGGRRHVQVAAVSQCRALRGDLDGHDLSIHSQHACGWYSGPMSPSRRWCCVERFLRNRAGHAALTLEATPP